MDPVVKTGGGVVRGFLDEGAATFLNLPFAEQPFDVEGGQRRFAAPEPATWEGELECMAYGPTAPQAVRPFTLIPEPIIEAPGSCLNLNLWTPDTGSGAGGLPVLVWIHGGGFVAGCNASPWYRGSRFARDGVVVVDIGYRLGADGFLPIEGTPDNRGVLDWLAALRWVQENIAEFGGDAGKVTIAGQSAGGGACLALMAVPAARGLFHRAIAQSGGGGFATSLDDATATTAELAARLNVEPTRVALTAVPLDAFLAGQTEPKQLECRPYIDGELLPEMPWKAIAAGAGGEVDLMIGATLEEGVATLRSSDIDDERLVRRLTRLGLSEKAIEAYRSRTADVGNGEVLGVATTDAMFRVPAARTADARIASGATGRTYSYDFRWRSPALGEVGAVHCLDIPFAWDLLDAEGVDIVAGGGAPQALATAIHGAWVSFVTSGDPGDSWPTYGEDRNVMLWDSKSKVAHDPLAWERGVWALDAPTPE